MEEGDILKEEANMDFVYGTRAIIESIGAGNEIERLYIQRGLKNELISDLIKISKDNHINFQLVPIGKLNRITRKNHQGAICFLSSIVYASLDHVIFQCYQKGKAPLLIILDRITDVRNFGAIARTAECAGVDGIIIPARGAAQITSDAMKTSAGSLNFIPVIREQNLKKTILELQNNGIQVLTCTEKTDKPLYDHDLTLPTAFLLGSEENGISPEYLKMATAKLKIPMLGKIDSLNVSVSAAVIIYEAVRQRGLK